ncbi:28382_t:CDS:2 [Gigaspora margarita]|uniref:28382_t:CDS:1 n=1 Tax=Gigaspora margarita TaxID=4874 RepID=A0ABN7URM9_GIGMA|nr:28382_t:CDS:2 [Gigaspora margarita]
MVTFAILNDLATINQPDKHYMVILFPDIENSNWKFLAICLGFNAANSKYFCPWCTCQKSKIGLINKSWTIEKSIESINQNIKSYSGHNKKPLFNIIKLKNWDLAIQEYKNDNRFSQECKQLICAEMNELVLLLNFGKFQDYKLGHIQLWDKFLALYEAIKNPLTNAEKFKVDAQNWINLFLTPSSGKCNTNNFVKGLYNPVDIMPYMHVLVYHVAEFMKIYNR